MGQSGQNEAPPACGSPELPSVLWVKHAADPDLPAWLSRIRKVTSQAPSPGSKGPVGRRVPEAPASWTPSRAHPGLPSHPPPERPGRAGTPALTQRGSVGDQDVYALGNEVPLLEQRLASREVEAPAVEPGLPVGEEPGAVRVGELWGSTGSGQQSAGGHRRRPDGGSPGLGRNAGLWGIPRVPFPPSSCLTVVSVPLRRTSVSYIKKNQKAKTSAFAEDLPGSRPFSGNPGSTFCPAPRGTVLCCPPHNSRAGSRGTLTPAPT